jgi:hypothetical protein
MSRPNWVVSPTTGEAKPRDPAEIMGQQQSTFLLWPTLAR